MLPASVELGLLPVLVLGAWTDLRARIVPNLLLLLGMLPLLMLTDWTLGLALRVFSGGLVGGLIFLPFYWKGGMGAADVKLLAFVGLYLGPGGVAEAALYTALVGGGMGLVDWATGMFGRRLPYAVAIGLGVMAFLFKRIL